MKCNDPPTPEQLLPIQRKVFACMYNMDQTPIQAEIPQDYSLEKHGAEDTCVVIADEN